MVNKSKSTKTKCNELANNINKLIKGVFNRDVFSIYDGIIEKIDIKNGTLNIRVPMLGNTLYEECRFMLPCSSSTAVIYPSLKINTPVIIGFKQFSPGKPIVLGFQPDTSLSIPLESNTISIINNKNKFIINESSIIITNGKSSITIDEDGIILTGTTITANGEDLTVDDEGAV